jgi:hypothetical protein
MLLAMVVFAPSALPSLACVASPRGGRHDGRDGDAAVTPVAPAVPARRLPARIRRLSNAELAATVAALLPGAPALGVDLVPDARPNQFSANAAQRVDPLYAAQLHEALHALATTAAPAVVTALGCRPDEGESCAVSFIEGFVTRAWRRPLGAGEKADLLEVFHSGATGATFTDGVALVVEAALQAASFLYLTELGVAPAKQGEVRLGPYEVASALAYFATGGPPDPPLMAAAAGEALGTASEREAQVRRLLATDGGRRQVQRFVTEWLGIDRLASTRKDNDVYPDFEPMRPYMIAETDAFIAEAVFHDEGTLTRLLTADYTVAAPALAAYYHLATDDAAGPRVALGRGPRRGLLTQGSFLAVYAHSDSSAPIARGVAVLDRLLCLSLPRPADPALTMTLPPPEPTRTTRARFQAHTRDPACASCHGLIDPVGFAFEGFDGMGQSRTEENGQPIVSAAELRAGDLVGPVDDAAALSGKLAASAAVEACLARNFFRFAAGLADEPLEATYLQSVWTPRSAGRPARILDLFVSWAASDMFVVRAVSP